MSDELRACTRDYRAGRLSKHEFIAAMHALHQRLFEYPSMIGGDVGRNALHQWPHGRHDLSEGPLRVSFR